MLKDVRFIITRTLFNYFGNQWSGQAILGIQAGGSAMLWHLPDISCGVGCD